MGVMVTVIIRHLGLATVTAEVIMAVILHMDGIMEAGIRVMDGIEAVMVMAGAFTVVIDKIGNIFRLN
jgi:hypothetical protein